MTIKPTDLMVVCAYNEDDVNSLQVNLLEETEDGDLNMFVHHEVPLADFPLCTAWMDFNLKGGDKGNFVAVGTMDPAIEIWDLDIVMFLETYNTVFLYSHQLLDCKAINDSGIWCYVTGR
jgi:periodic tryptophan protein 1